MIRIFPSLMNTDLTSLQKSIRQLEPYCDGFHIDIMDNQFVPNIGIGADTANAIARETSKPIWVHLMVKDPITWCSRLILPPHSIVSFHIEAVQDVRTAAKCITEKKWMPSIAINPKTNAEEIFSILDIIDHVLIMSVNPGSSGQRFLPEALPKAHTLLKHAQRIKKKIVLGMDGGINESNIKEIAQAGIVDIAAASAIFNVANPINAIQKLRSAATHAQSM